MKCRQKYCTKSTNRLLDDREKDNNEREQGRLIGSGVFLHQFQLEK